MRNLVVTLAMLTCTTAAIACPTCGGVKEVLPPSQESATIADRFNGSIFVLLGTVVLAMGFLGWQMYRSSGSPKKQDDTVNA